MQLTTENYHSPEANRAYLSCSQIKRWQECQARALAEYEGRWKQEPTEAMLIGSYVDRAITEPAKLEAFISGHPEMFTKSGGLKASFAQAAAMIDKIHSVPDAMEVLRGGENQAILTGTIAGAPFRAMMDVVHWKRQCIVDLKTARSICTAWDKETKKYQPWYYRYWLQAAIYRELARQKTGELFDFILVAVTKQNPPASQSMAFPKESLSVSGRLEFELATLDIIVPEILAQRAGQKPAPGCGDFDNCEFCRANSRFEFVLAEA